MVLNQRPQFMQFDLLSRRGSWGCVRLCWTSLGRLGNDDEDVWGWMRVGMLSSRSAGDLRLLGRFGRVIGEGFGDVDGVKGDVVADSVCC